MLPPVLFTVMTPSATVHLTGDLSLLVTHSSRLLPSKSTMASEGGAVQVAPGVTTLGTGSQTSVSSGFWVAGVWEKSGADKAINAEVARSFENCIRIIRQKYTEVR